MFARVRDAFPSQFRPVMEKLEVEILREKDDGWCEAKCPLCADKSGSAGVHSRTGYLKCHQCAFSGELFVWIQKKRNLSTAWEACLYLAETLNLPIPTVKEGKRESRVL